MKNLTYESCDIAWIWIYVYLTLEEHVNKHKLPCYTDLVWYVKLVGWWVPSMKWWYNDDYW